MKEVHAENPIEIKQIDDGVEIEVPGDRPPLFPLVILLLLSVFIVIGSDGRLWWLSIPIILFCVWAFKFHKKSQFITLTKEKVMARNKSFDLDKITSVELRNALSDVPVAQHSGSVVVVRGGGVWGAAATSGAVLGDAMGRAMMGVVNMSLKSGAKKAYFVQISYGTKKYILANRMRLPRAEGLYRYLTDPSR